MRRRFCPGRRCLLTLRRRKVPCSYYAPTGTRDQVQTERSSQSRAWEARAQLDASGAAAAVQEAESLLGELEVQEQAKAAMMQALHTAHDELRR